LCRSCLFVPLLFALVCFCSRVLIMRMLWMMVMSVMLMLLLMLPLCRTVLLDVPVSVRPQLADWYAANGDGRHSTNCVPQDWLLCRARVPHEGPWQSMWPICQMCLLAPDSLSHWHLHLG
jgi:hypothetical protein